MDRAGCPSLEKRKEERTEERNVDLVEKTAARLGMKFFRRIEEAKNRKNRG